eukprot:1549216-Amphidinium_carterae.1
MSVQSLGVQDTFDEPATDPSGLTAIRACHFVQLGQRLSLHLLAHQTLAQDVVVALGRSDRRSISEPYELAHSGFRVPIGYFYQGLEAKPPSKFKGICIGAPCFCDARGATLGPLGDARDVCCGIHVRPTLDCPQ